MINVKKLIDQNVAGKTVLIRADMNVPIHDGHIVDDARIRASLPSIQYCLTHGAAVIVMTHLGRPKEGAPQAKDSVEPIAARLGQCLGQPVSILDNFREHHPSLAMGSVSMLPNVRLNVGEKSNDMALGQVYADLCDIYVNDAFGTAHRKEASTKAVARVAKAACAGILLMSELDALSRIWQQPKKPLVAIVGGSKVSTKLTILDALAEQVDQLIVGGGIANTFLLAAGHHIGQSLAEPDLVEEAKKIMDKMSAKGGRIPLPTDVVVAKSCTADAAATIKDITAVSDDDLILDIGPNSAQVLADVVKTAGTVVWNGPMGVFELPPFSQGTRTLAQAIADSSAISLAGGGDTLAAIAQFGIGEQLSYISTGGGAFLEFLEGKTLPAVAALQS